MRIWTVPYEQLDAARVLGQHREVHMLIGYVLSGRKWADLYDDGKPLTADDLEYLWWVHELTVIEMFRRGWTGHKTPVHRVRVDRSRFFDRMLKHLDPNGKQVADRELLRERQGEKMAGNSFNDELGRVHYRVETDTRDETFESAVYTLDAKRQRMAELRQRYGRSNVWWVPNPSQRKK